MYNAYDDRKHNYALLAQDITLNPDGEDGVERRCATAHPRQRQPSYSLGRGLIQLLLVRPFSGAVPVRGQARHGAPLRGARARGCTYADRQFMSPAPWTPSRASSGRWCSNTWQAVTFGGAGEGKRAVNLGPLRTLPNGTAGPAGRIWLRHSPAARSRQPIAPQLRRFAQLVVCPGFS
jgi:hypothetical protein